MKTIASHEDRRAEIEKMTFSEFTKIVLEVRDAVVQKVKNSIPANRQVVMILGNAGAGKSTVLCALRGDQMRAHGSRYISVNDQERLIGHEGATSCTFLPNIEILGDLALIDFPGFEDTHGPVIALGMECALKAIFKRCKPKVLVLDAITNTQQKYASAAKLGATLSRLFENPNDCILGLTKYSQDPDYDEIKTIEREERKKIQTDISKLNGRLKAYSGPNIRKTPEVEAKIVEAKGQLASLQKGELLETEVKRRHREAIKVREEEFLRQIGLGSLLRFDDLEKPETLARCRQVLSEHQDRVSVNRSSVLDPDHAALIRRLFKNNLEGELMARNADSTQVQDVAAFTQKVLDTSLMNTIAPPEIGQFLHLPEIDPNLVREFDKEIVHDYLRKYKEAVISLLNNDLINKLIDEIEKIASKGKVKNLKDQWIQLRNYIMRLEGIEIPSDPSDAEKKWGEIQRTYETKIDEIEKKFEVSTLAFIGLCIPAGIPYAILELFKRKVREKQWMKRSIWAANN